MLLPSGKLSMDVILLVLLATAVWADLRTRRIPNPLIAMGLVAGILGQALLEGGAGLASAGSGALVGLLCLLPFYATGSMGAGDVKLMAVCGAFLGPLMVFLAAAASLLIGGAIGLFWYFRYEQEPAEASSLAIREPVGGQERNGAPAVAPAGIPYALAIAAGSLCSLAAVDTVTALFTGAKVG